MKKHNCIILLGKSGSGKDTIFKKVIEDTFLIEKYLHPLIWNTTRPKRQNESDTTYNFVDYGDLLNHKIYFETAYNGWEYFIHAGNVSNDDKIEFLIGNLQLMQSEKFHDYFNVLKTYIIEANDKERLLRQLQREANPNVKEIVRRFDADEKEYNNWKSSYQDLLINNYEILINNNEEDLKNNVKNIIHFIYRGEKEWK